MGVESANWGRCQVCGAWVRDAGDRSGNVVNVLDGIRHAHPGDWHVSWEPAPKSSNRHALWSAGIAVAVIVAIIVYSLVRYA